MISEKQEKDIQASIESIEATIRLLSKEVEDLKKSLTPRKKKVISRGLSVEEKARIERRLFKPR